MARHIFISYQHEDRMKAKGFNLLRWNKNVDFEFVGRHLLDPVDSKDEDYITRKVHEQMTGTSATVVLLGKNTAQSEWVQHEIEKSVEKKNGIVAIKLDDSVSNPPKDSPVGKALYEAGAEIIDWKPETFEAAIERACKASGRAQAAAVGLKPDCAR
ncbi:MAG TPA: TIR domain-containing protein [Candidatus Angelobacter sp.]|nr:TIR domain-containing protein [Candidatus Angelobacter sp.]